MIKDYWNSVVKNLIRRRKLSDFLAFFVFTFALWLLLKLSESHNAALNFEIEYTSVPDDKILLGEPPGNINVTVKGVGYAILKYRIFKKILKLDVSRAELSNQNYMLSNDYLESAVKEQLDKNLSLQSLHRKSIILNLGQNSRRKIPVEYDVDIYFERDFDIYGDIKVDPDSILVRGPENLVDTLTVLKTDKIVLTNVNTDISQEVPLRINKTLQSLSFSTKKVRIIAKVIRFTEKIVEVPVKITKKPDNLTVRLFPETVKVKCIGSLSDLKKVLPNDLLITADFSRAEDTGVLIPVIEKYPEYLRSAEIIDKKLEFLIKKE